MPSNDESSESDSNGSVLTGSCLCGTSRYTVNGPPAQAIICHCNNCKKWSGGAFAANIWIPEQYFHVDEASSSSIRVYEDSNTDAGRTLNRAFCSNCGSSLYVGIPYFGIVSVTRGSADSVEELEGVYPVVEFYCKRKLAWAEIGGETDRKQALE